MASKSILDVLEVFIEVIIIIVISIATISWMRYVFSPTSTQNVDDANLCGANSQSYDSKRHSNTSDTEEEEMDSYALWTEFYSTMGDDELDNLDNYLERD